MTPKRAATARAAPLLAAMLTLKHTQTQRKTTTHFPTRNGFSVDKIQPEDRRASDMAEFSDQKVEHKTSAPVKNEQLKMEQRQLENEVKHHPPGCCCLEGRRKSAEDQDQDQ